MKITFAVVITLLLCLNYCFSQDQVKIELTEQNMKDQNVKTLDEEVQDEVLADVVEVKDDEKKSLADLIKFLKGGCCSGNRGSSSGSSNDNKDRRGRRHGGRRRHRQEESITNDKSMDGEGDYKDKKELKYTAMHCYWTCQQKICLKSQKDSHYFDKCKKNIEKMTLLLNNYCEKVSFEKCDKLPAQLGMSALHENFHSCWYSCNFDPNHNIHA